MQILEEGIEKCNMVEEERVGIINNQIWTWNELMLEISELRPQGEKLEAHVRPHISVTVEKPVPFEGREMLNL